MHRIADRFGLKLQPVAGKGISFDCAARQGQAVHHLAEKAVTAVRPERRPCGKGRKQGQPLGFQKRRVDQDRALGSLDQHAIFAVAVEAAGEAGRGTLPAKLELGAHVHTAFCPLPATIDVI